MIKNTILPVIALFGFPFAIDAQTIGDANSDYSQLKTSTYVDDRVNNLTSLASILSCVVQKSGVGMAETLNKTWRATVPEADCISSSWPGMIDVVASTQRVSNDTPQDTLMWIDIETSQKRFVLAMNSWQSAQEAPPYGVFDMKFYLVQTETVVPTNAQDLARIYTEIVDDMVVLRSARNNRSEDYYELAKVEYTNGASDFRFVAQDETSTLIGVASPDFFFASQADGSEKTCKSRQNTYSNAWNNKLFDTTTGQAIEPENGTIPIQLLDDNLDPVKFGTGFVSPSNFYFRNRIRGSAKDNVFSAKNRVTDEQIDLVWTPARVYDVKRKALTVEVGDVFFNQYELRYDGTGLAYVDQTVDEATCRCEIEVANGVKYHRVQTNGLRMWHRPFNTEIVFLPKNTGDSFNPYEIAQTAYVGVRIPMESSSSFLSTTEPTAMVCVSDWSCPHVIDNETTVFGQTDLRVFQDDFGKIAVTDELRNVYFRPRSLLNDASPTRRHNYLLTPLDVSELPEGTMPATLYYDTNGNQELDSTEKPIMTHFINKLRFMDENGDTYEDDRWYNGATGVEITDAIGDDHNNDALGLGFNLVTLEDYINGCDGAGDDGIKDASFVTCENLYRYDTGPNHWGSRFFVKRDGAFLNQESPVAVLYTAKLDADLNAGVNDRIKELGGEPAGKTYRLNGESFVRNQFTRRNCTSDCFQEAGPEAIEDMEMILTHDGREFYPLPGDHVTIPGASSELTWFSAMSLKSGTVLDDLFDETKQYIVKNVAVSQRLGLVPNDVCNSAEYDLAYTDIRHPAFENLQLSDLPPLDFDEVLEGMPTWSDRPRSDEINAGCYVDNGRLIGTCME